ncbi:MAG: hypothetical protein M1537_08860 [Nitrospirae bacterium]|nr:hypothetical protein [Nitrospirota bacterium]MCL5286088.1 hypothetical protein [Nitrospirota bacterium]
MERISFVLASDSLEKLHAVGLMASVAAVSQMEVNVFVTMNAITAFRKSTVEKKGFRVEGEVGRHLLEKNSQMFYDLLEQGKMMGSLKVYACAMALELVGEGLDKYLPVFDEVLGVAGFLGKAGGGQVLFV